MYVQVSSQPTTINQALLLIELQNLTYVDFLHLTDANLLKMAGSDIMESEKRPNVSRWYNELRARPSWGFNQSSVGGNFKRDHPAVILEEKDKETANM